MVQSPLLQRPPDRSLAALVLGHGLAGRVALGDRAALASIKSGRPAELGALALGAGDPFLAALADQPAFELGDAAHDREHEPADLGSDVAPSFAKADKAAFVRDPAF